MMNLLKRRAIKGFKPNKQMGWTLSKKRLKVPTMIILMITLLVVLGFALVWVFGNADQVKIFGIAIITLQALATVTFFVIFDNGAANRLRRLNFKVDGIKNKEQGHTYYYSLKQSGFIRLFINLSILGLYVVISLLSFLI